MFDIFRVQSTGGAPIGQGRICGQELAQPGRNGDPFAPLHYLWPLLMRDHEEFWARCRRAMPNDALGDRYVVRRMGNAPAICEALLGFVTTGQKTGLFSRPEELEASGLMPRSGDLVIFTNYAGIPRCLVRMEDCRRLKFCEIGPEHTACESPAARDLAIWRGIHRRYWTPILAAEGIDFTEDMLVLFQRFRLLYSEPPMAQGD